MPKQYPKDFSEHAVRLVTETQSNHNKEWQAIREVAIRLSVGPETAGKWVRQK